MANYYKAFHVVSSERISASVLAELRLLDFNWAVSSLHTHSECMPHYHYLFYSVKVHNFHSIASIFYKDDNVLSVFGSINTSLLLDFVFS